MLNCSVKLVLVLQCCSVPSVFVQKQQYVFLALHSSILSLMDLLSDFQEVEKCKNDKIVIYKEDHLSCSSGPVRNDLGLC